MINVISSEAPTLRRRGRGRRGLRGGRGGHPAPGGRAHRGAGRQAKSY